MEIGWNQGVEMCVCVCGDCCLGLSGDTSRDTHLEASPGARPVVY